MEAVACISVRALIGTVALAWFPKGTGLAALGFIVCWQPGKKTRVRNFKTLHEIFHVYVDGEVLRTDHEIRFIGLTILRLHYKMTIAETKTIGEDLP